MTIAWYQIYMVSLVPAHRHYFISISPYHRQPTNRPTTTRWPTKNFISFFATCGDCHRRRRRRERVSYSWVLCVPFSRESTSFYSSYVEGLETVGVGHGHMNINVCCAVIAYSSAQQKSHSTRCIDFVDTPLRSLPILCLPLSRFNPFNSMTTKLVCHFNGVSQHKFIFLLVFLCRLPLRWAACSTQKKRKEERNPRRVCPSLSVSIWNDDETESNLNDNICYMNMLLVGACVRWENVWKKNWLWMDFREKPFCSRIWHISCRGMGEKDTTICIEWWTWFIDNDNSTPFIGVSWWQREWSGVAVIVTVAVVIVRHTTERRLTWAWRMKEKE